MPLNIPREMEKNLPPRVRTSLAELSDEKQQMFVDSYKRLSRSYGLMLGLEILIPIQHFFLGKVGLGILFWLTVGGLGFWWIIEWFLTGKRVAEYNASLAEDILADIKTS